MDEAVTSRDPSLQSLTHREGIRSGTRVGRYVLLGVVGRGGRAVVYRALEGGITHHADERFVEHELVESLFQKILAGRHATHEWKSRVSVLADLMRRHIETEEGGLFVNLSERYSAEELVELGTQFMLARDKLTMLEEAKKAA